ncbi:MAG: hypothetical protein ABI318_03990, partial [Chthoniobacteraceae bacterium]
QSATRRRRCVSKFMPMLKFGKTYVESGEQAHELHLKNRLLHNLQKQATHLSYHLVPQPAANAPVS